MIPSEGCPDVEQGVLTRHSLLFLYPLAVSLASGGWGRSPQASKLTSAWPHALETLRIAKAAACRQLSSLTAREAALRVRMPPRQRPGAFRAAGGVLRAGRGERLEEGWTESIPGRWGRSTGWEREEEGGGKNLWRGFYS